MVQLAPIWFGENVIRTVKSAGLAVGGALTLRSAKKESAEVLRQTQKSRCRSQGERKVRETSSPIRTRCDSSINTVLIISKLLVQGEIK